METITIEDIAQKLGYHDFRPARNWCEQNHVILVRQGREEFASLVNFEIAFLKPIADALKVYYGAEWNKIYQEYLTGDPEAIEELVIRNTASTSPIKRKKAGSTNQFTSKLDEYLKEKVA